MPELPQDFLASLIEDIKSPAVVGITMAGSFSRGQGTQFSDVDIQLYVTERPQDVTGSLTLKMFQGYLVSLHYDNLAEERAKLLIPQDAVWAVPGLRQCVILYDKDGSLEDLKRAAREFTWSPLQPLADQYASRAIMKCTEEVYKIMGGLQANDESKVLYASLGLFMNMAHAVIVQRGVLVESENRYLELAQQAMGLTSNWTRHFRIALGLEGGDHRTRGKASLGLFQETARQFDPIIQQPDRDVIMNMLMRIPEFL